MTSTCVVRPVDFINKRDTRVWTVGMLRHLVHALNGSPVAITTEAQTGHTLVGVKLVGVSGGRGDYDYSHLMIENNGQVMHHLIFQLGEAIIPLEDGQAKWTAIKTYREECSAATQAARESRDGANEWWGAWSANPGLYDVGVTYTPHTGNPAFADRWHTHEYFTILAPGPTSALTL